MMLSTLPAWELVHPMVIHFPIVLLLIAPLFICIGAALPPPKGRPFLLSALILLTLGTASLFVTISAGEAAAKVLPKEGQIGELIVTHQDLAFETMGIFVMLLVLFVAILLVPRVLHRDGRLFSTVLPLAFLLLYCAGAVVLVSTAHDGGRLVHDFGVHAVAPSSGQNPQLARHSAN